MTSHDPYSSGEPHDPRDPAGQQPPADPGSWTHPSPDQPGYAAGPGQPGYGAGQPSSGGWAPQPEQKLGRATTALVLGIVALAGGAACVLPAVVGPVAWFLGAKARREIDAYPGRWTNRSEATAGMVMGIVSTVLLALLVLLLVVLVITIGAWDQSGTLSDSQPA